jgi:3-mercaptopyruvate sulfurtransferase SseA
MKPTYQKPSPNRTLPLILMISGAVLVVAVLIYVLTNAPTTTAPQAISSGITTPFPDVVRVSLADAKQAYDNQTALIVDVRDAGSYAAGHIPGAVNIPLDEIETRMNELPKDKWIITYCT